MADEAALRLSVGFHFARMSSFPGSAWERKTARLLPCGPEPRENLVAHGRSRAGSAFPGGAWEREIPAGPIARHQLQFSQSISHRGDLEWSSTRVLCECLPPA